MRLSKKCRYAIKSLIDLVKNYQGAPISIRDISKRQNVSLRYLENIFHDLKKSEILASVKGKGGGFSLSKNIEDISLLDIIEALEGKLEIVDCVAHEDRCDQSTECYTHDLWISLNKTIKDSFQNIKLANIIKNI
jgi:Rrf2 family iron-sulfur cluster assembly transcriptional regulator